jgi:hypothetical protein
MALVHYIQTLFVDRDNESQSLALMILRKRIMEECLVPIFIGAVQGLFTGLLIFNIDEFIKRIGVIAGNILGGGGVIFLAVESFPKFNFQQLKIPSFIYLYLGLLLVSFLITIFVIASRLKKRKIPPKIDIYDVLFGQKKALERIWKIRVQYIEDELNIEAMQKEKEQVRKEKEQVLSKEEEVIVQIQKLETLKKDIKESSKFTIVLPENQPVPITDRFIKLIPSFIDGVVKFCTCTSELLSEFEKEIKGGKRTSEEVVLGYLNALCSYSCVALFGNGDVRAHFRILHSGNYEMIMCNLSDGKWEGSVTPIPASEGMICAAGKCKRSMIKEHNLKHHYETDRKHIYTNYITLVFDEFFDNDVPIISMGISVKCNVMYDELLDFINYIKIEQFIQSQLIRLRRVVGSKCMLEILHAQAES